MMEAMRLVGAAGALYHPEAATSGRSNRRILQSSGNHKGQPNQKRQRVDFGGDQTGVVFFHAPPSYGYEIQHHPPVPTQQPWISTENQSPPTHRCVDWGLCSSAQPDAGVLGASPLPVNAELSPGSNTSQHKLSCHQLNKEHVQDYPVATIHSCTLSKQEPTERFPECHLLSSVAPQLHLPSTIANAQINPVFSSSASSRFVTDSLEGGMTRIITSSCEDDPRRVPATVTPPILGEPDLASASIFGHDDLEALYEVATADPVLMTQFPHQLTDAGSGGLNYEVGDMARGQRRPANLYSSPLGLPPTSFDMPFHLAHGWVPIAGTPSEVAGTMLTLQTYSPEADASLQSGIPVDAWVVAECPHENDVASSQYGPAVEKMDSDMAESESGHEDENTSIMNEDPARAQVKEPSSPQKKTKRKPKTAQRKGIRSAFSEKLKEETNLTRKDKACVRCRMQRVRCVRDGNDPETCRTCQDVNPASKKRIHRLPCLRLLLTDITLYRPGSRSPSLELTQRWKGTQMRDLTGWADEHVRTIRITLDLCEEDLELEVRRFKPLPGDVLERFWVDDQRIRRSKVLAPYGLANVEKTAEYYADYIQRNAFPALKQALATRDSDDLIKEAYMWAYRRFEILRRKQGAAKLDEFNFMAWFFQLWFAIRHTVGSSHIVGEETLGMQPENEDQTYVLFGKVSVPRMIIAQFDGLNYVKLLQPLQQKCVKLLQSMVEKKNDNWWFTIFISIFILLHEVSVASKDRARHAFQNSAPTQYSLPKFVEDLQHSANNLLMHWHYYRRRDEPLLISSEARQQTRLAFMEPEEFNFVVKAYKNMRSPRRLEDIQIMREGKNWDHELYWVSQMFQEGDWSPGPYFRA